MIEIPKALIQLKAESGEKNWSKIRKYLARFLDIQRQLMVLTPQMQSYVIRLISKVYIAGVEQIVFYDEGQKMSKNDLISFTRNCIVTFRHLGYHKELFTYVTDDGTPQKKMNKKYPQFQC